MEAAAKDLGVNRTTVARHISALEDNLESRVLTRGVNGYEPTDIGLEILDLANEVEEQVISIERRVSGRDQKLDGEIRISTPLPLAAGVMAPLIAEFSRQFPDIRLYIQGTNELTDLDRREADVVIRLTKAPPPNWIGRRLTDVNWCLYEGRDGLPATADGTTPFITSDVHPIDERIILERLGSFRMVAQSNDAMIVREMIAKGIGVGPLPCSMGDRDRRLRRRSKPLPSGGWGFWILTHEDLRETQRVRRFMQFMGDGLKKHADLFTGDIEGKEKSDDRLREMVEELKP
jgi:DNA-binding transcriptional LysR family regulator